MSASSAASVDDRAGPPVRLRDRARTSAACARASASGPCASTTRSTMPCSSRNSERWKPGGSCWRIVCSITRGPAKPISASGSAMMMSPSIATEAATPPVVGCSSTEMYGTLRLAQPRPRRRGLRHLHQRQHALLHARAAGRAEHDRRPPVRDGALELARDLLADDRAHRAAHELEHEEADLDRDAADRRGAGAVGVAGPDLAGRALDLIDVLLAVDPEARADRRSRAPGRAPARSRDRC